MAKKIHEIRDPIHVFIRVEDSERKALDSRALQRLRHIHHLAMTYLIYPGATHRRFEHSLGVMDLASRVYDIVTNERNIHEELKNLFPNPDSLEHVYWRRVLRMAALFHDVGHLPFSHAAEKELLPSGWDHERITLEIIYSKELSKIWKELGVYPTHIAKLAIGPEKYEKYKKVKRDVFDDWQTILSEIITGDAFGVDRIDYLLRDSHHAGVAYGKFDHYRLIDTLRVLPRDLEGSKEPALGVEEGGLHSAEALLFARYFMFKQVYLHPVRRIYDIHLKDFLKATLPHGKFLTNVDKHMLTTDNDIISDLLKAERDKKHLGHLYAKCIIARRHFRLLYDINPDDRLKNPEAGKAIHNFFVKKYDEKNVRHDPYKKEPGGIDFPVLERDGRIVSSLAKSATLHSIPPASIDYIFVSPEYYKEANEILKKNRESIISRMEKEK